MKNLQKNQTPSPTRKVLGESGFALVATLSLMILLVILAVGLLSLSAVTLRSSGQSAAQAEARANARMALMVAIGELQKQMGPDQRISANGAIMDDPTTSGNEIPNSQWTGVWNSWKAGVGESSQHSTLPDVTDEMAPTYLPSRKDYFRSWLVSLLPEDATNWEAAKNLVLDGKPLPDRTATAVQIVGVGSLGQNPLAADLVNARLIPVKTRSGNPAPSGRYAWWVGDESQKAKILSDSYITTPAANNAEKILRAQAPDSTGTKSTQGLETISDADEKKLTALVSRKTLDVVPSVNKVVRNGKGIDASKFNFHSSTLHSVGVLADVREGGLKRDLSILLERPIVPTETTDNFMLYRFNVGGRDERVPIQDLSAFYQLYDQTRYVGGAEDWRKKTGILHTSSRLANTPHIVQPDLGTTKSPPEFQRQYARMYQSVVPIKIQLIVTSTAHPIVPTPTDPNADTHFIRLHFMPAVTFWNPTNLPLVLNLNNQDAMMQHMRFMSAGFNFHWRKNGSRVAFADPNTSRPMSLAYAAYGDGNSGRGGWNSSSRNAITFEMFFATGTDRITFEPGEVRVFSYNKPPTTDAFRFHKHINDQYQPLLRAISGWNADVTFPCSNSIWGSGANVTSGGSGFGPALSVKGTDEIAVELTTDLVDGTDNAFDNEWRGAAFGYMMIQKNFQQRNPGLAEWFNRHYPMLSRRQSGGTYGSRTNATFNDVLIRKGFPAETILPSHAVSKIITATEKNSNRALFQFALMAGTETHETQSSFAFGGRKFAARPFLHSSTIAPPNVDQNDGNSLYNHGLNWWVRKINTVLEANIQVEEGVRNRSYFGGGFNDTRGTTHVVQQEVPITPPISVAALNQAHLGGFSMASTANPSLDNPIAHSTGSGGMSPFTLSAIGNSYAHPNIPSAEASTTSLRKFDGSAAAERPQIFVDHSYLANKALWDEFFFSSITPQNSSRVAIFNTTLTAEKVTENFFFNNGTLLNRRLIPYSANLNESKLTDILTQKGEFSNGLADKIASHLLVDGAFNVNSTSVEAWKIFFSSLKGKPVTYLDRSLVMTGGAFKDAQLSPNGVMASGFAVPLTAPVAGGSAEPKSLHQWVGSREITDTEINELARSMVAQVKARGPFLSLSEFVNRRLDSGNLHLAVKGALQAALDYNESTYPGLPSVKFPDVPESSINKSFRSPLRQFSKEEMDQMTPLFPGALSGPVAYGSNAYVDQADILRNFSEQLTPRGDTFVIRSYGDSLDANGDVIARAWCEAVLQRIPEYNAPGDEAHEKNSDLTDTNKNFGRIFKVVSFRWLNPTEV